jgi:hypothetical protein
LKRCQQWYGGFNQEIRKIDMSIMMRTLPLTMILLSAPALAEPPGKAKKADGAQSAKDYAPGHNENKGKHNEENDSYDCSNIKNDDARKRCREEKYDGKHTKNDKDGSSKENDAYKRSHEEKTSKNDEHRGKECDNVQGDIARKVCLDKYQYKNKEKR